MSRTLSRAGFVGPNLAVLLTQSVQPGGQEFGPAARLASLAVRIAQELEVRGEAARAYALREGATDLVRVQLERDELRAQIRDFIAGVLP